MRTLAVISFLLISLLIPISASAEVFDLDAAHTSIGFSVKHLGLSMVSGTYQDFKGTIDWNGKNMETGKVEVTIQAASIDTRIKKRDEDLRDSFFEVAKYPVITFKSTKVVSTGPETAKVTGLLSIKGITKEVVLDVTFLGTVEKDPWGMTRSAFRATGVINRKDFDVKSGSVLSDGAVGNDVLISIETEAIKK